MTTEDGERERGGQQWRVMEDCSTHERLWQTQTLAARWSQVRRPNHNTSKRPRVCRPGKPRQIASIHVLTLASRR